MKTVNKTLINLYWGIGQEIYNQQPNFNETLPEKYVNQAKLAVKDEYVFDFMELDEQHSERELERSLINNIKEFLEEMGGNFAFMGNQYHINVGGDDFYIDLLLYHRTLKSLVAIENIRNDFMENIKISPIDETIKLQQDYKSGIIKEEDLTEEQYNSLIKLYDKQIDDYKTSISMKKEQLRGYKNRIKEMRKKLA